jgi:30S ribosomal protein S31
LILAIIAASCHGAASHGVKLRPCPALQNGQIRQPDRGICASRAGTPRPAPVGLYTFLTSWQEVLSMGKGDTRSRRGKIYNGSYGKKRPHRARRPAVPGARPAKSGAR